MTSLELEILLKRAEVALARRQFEAWLLDEQDLTAEWDEERRCYKEFAAHLAFRSWLAAKRN